MRLVIAGGDGSLIGAVTAAMEAGVDISKMPCCVLPFGTGNDFARCTNWGGTPTGEMFRNLNSLMREICENSREEKINVWTVKVTFKARGGDTFEVDSRTRNLVGKGHEYFERDMINYCGLGEDGRVGVAFERYRTNSRCCNLSVYGVIGACFFLGCCRGDTVAQQIEYIRTLDKKEADVGINKSDANFEESKDTSLMKPLINSEVESDHNANKGIILTSKKKDKNNFSLKGNPICIVAPNIASFAGGKANLWGNGLNKSGLQNPYVKKGT